MTDRAVSTMVGYIMMVAIAAILLASVTLAATALVDSQDQRTAAAELDVYGERLAADIQTADRLAQRGSNTDVTVTTDLPYTVNGHQYTIAIGDEEDGDSDTTIVLQPDDSERQVTIGVAKTTNVRHDEEIRGGPIQIRYVPGTNGDPGELVIERE